MLRMAGTGPLPGALALVWLVAFAVLGSFGCATPQRSDAKEGGNPIDSGEALGPEVSARELALVDPAAANPPPADAGAGPAGDPLFDDPGYELPPPPDDPLQ